MVGFHQARWMDVVACTLEPIRTEREPATAIVSDLFRLPDIAVRFPP